MTKDEFIERYKPNQKGIVAFYTNKEFQSDLSSVIESERKEYFELVFAVETKFPNETRHQTALKFIKQRQMLYNIGCDKEAIKSAPLTKGVSNGT